MGESIEDEIQTWECPPRALSLHLHDVSRTRLYFSTAYLVVIHYGYVWIMSGNIYDLCLAFPFPFLHCVFEWEGAKLRAVWLYHGFEIEHSNVFSFVLYCFFWKCLEFLFAFSPTADSSASIFMKQCPVAPSLHSWMSVTRLEPAHIYMEHVFFFLMLDYICWRWISRSLFLFS